MSASDSTKALDCTGASTVFGNSIENKYILKNSSSYHQKQGKLGTKCKDCMQERTTTGLYVANQKLLSAWWPGYHMVLLSTTWIALSLWLHDADASVITLSSIRCIFKTNWSQLFPSIHLALCSTAKTASKFQLKRFRTWVGLLWHFLFGLHFFFFWLKMNALLDKWQHPSGIK